MNLNEVINIIEDVFHTLDGDIDETFANEANLLAKALGELYKIQKEDEEVKESVRKIEKIKQIVAIDNQIIQEDIMKYQMICEVLK